VLFVVVYITIEDGVVDLFTYEHNGTKRYNVKIYLCRKQS